MSTPVTARERHLPDPAMHDLALEDELARISSDVQALAIRHGITHAASIDTASLIRALQSIARNRPATPCGDVPVVAVFAPKPAEARDERHAREVAAVRASLELAPSRAERHGCYAKRAPKAA